MRPFRALALYVVLVGALVAAFTLCGPVGHAQGLATPDQVHAWISDYAWEYATPSYGHDALVADAERVARCESDHFNLAVINDGRLGRLGEVGTFQFLPGPRSIFWSTPSAAAGWDYWDAEANVAGGVWLISRGFGPRNWSCW